ncbi:MAG TPA: chemotaxis protein CheW [Usitatibacter sp.]
MSSQADLERREFLTCHLGSESYGVDILLVQEIREVAEVTRVPHVSRFVRGVVNLRGAIVPIVDLGLMFGLPEPLDLKTASAIVLNVDQRMVGLIVSSVSDVVALAPDEILPAPELAAREVSAAIAGIGSRRGSQAADSESSILLLDVEHIMRRVREERE